MSTMKSKTIAVNLFAGVISFIVQFIISFWVSPYVVSKLGEEAYGFLNLANNFVQYSTLLTVAINSMASRYISVEYNRGNVEDAKKYFASVFWANCLIYVVIFSAASILIYNLQAVIKITPELVTQVKITFFIAFINLGFSLIGTVYTAAAYVTNKMHLNSIIQIIANFIKAICIFLLFLLLPAKIYYLSIAILANGIFVFAGNYALTKKLTPEFTASRKYVESSKIITLIKSGIWMLISNISNILLNGLDLLISNQMINGSAMGRLSLAKQVPNAISNMLGYFLNIFSASLTRTFATGSTKNIVKETKTLLRVLTAFLCTPIAGIVVYGKLFISFWLSASNYSNGQINEIYTLMVIVLGDITVSTFMYSIHSVFIALDKIKFYSLVNLTASFISIFATLLIVKNTGLGVYAIAGTSTLILSITNTFIVPAYAAKLLKEKIYSFWISELRSWILLFMLMLLFFLIKRFFIYDSWMSFIITVLINGILGYIISFFVMFTKEERGKITDNAMRRFKK